MYWSAPQWLVVQMCARPVLCCLNMLLIGFAATTIGVLFWLEHGLPRFPLYVPIAVSTLSVTSGFLGCVAQFQGGCRRAHWAIFSIPFLLLVGVFLFMMLRKYVVVRLLLQSGRNTVKAASDVLLFCQITFFLMILSQTAVVGSSCCCRGKRLRDAERPVIGHAAQTHARHTDSTHSWPRPMASCRIEISTTNDRVFRSASDDRVPDSGAPSGRFSAGSTSSGDVPWARDCEGSRVAEIFARETAPMPFGPRAARVTRDLQVEYMRQLTNNSERQRHSMPESEELAGGYSSSETVPDAEFEILPPWLVAQMCARPVLCCLNMLLIGFAATTIGVLFWLEHGLPRFPLYVPIAVSTFTVTSGFLGCVAQFRWGSRGDFSSSPEMVPHVPEVFILDTNKGEGRLRCRPKHRRQKKKKKQVDEEANQVDEEAKAILGKPLSRMQGKLGGKAVSILIDTGASCNIISPSAAKRIIGLKISAPAQPNVTFVQADGNSLSVIGQVDAVGLVLDGWQGKLNLAVLDIDDDSGHDMILGMEWLVAYDCHILTADRKLLVLPGQGSSLRHVIQCEVC